MGNRDVRRREKRKPKKKESKQTSTPARIAVFVQTPLSSATNPGSNEALVDSSLL